MISKRKWVLSVARRILFFAEERWLCVVPHLPDQVKRKAVHWINNGLTVGFSIVLTSQIRNQSANCAFCYQLAKRKWSCYLMKCNCHVVSCQVTLLSFVLNAFSQANNLAYEAFFQREPIYLLLLHMHFINSDIYVYKWVAGKCLCHFQTLFALLGYYTSYKSNSPKRTTVQL